MHVQIQGCCNVVVAELSTYRLIVTFTLDAACRETVAEPVIFQTWDSETFHQTVIVVAVCTWFRRLLLIGQHVELFIDNFLQL